MSNFDRAFEEIIGVEGGYVDNPNDRGGETKYGISKRSYPNEDIKNLTLERAKEIYYNDFWRYRKLSLQQFDDYNIQLEIFDTAVNSGTHKAGTIVQEALNLMNRNQRDFNDLVVDGWLGSKTIRAYKKVDSKILLKVLNGLQFMNYVRICESNPSQEVFFNGWMKRV